MVDKERDWLDCKYRIPQIVLEEAFGCLPQELLIMNIYRYEVGVPAQQLFLDLTARFIWQLQSLIRNILRNSSRINSQSIMIQYMGQSIREWTKYGRHPLNVLKWYDLLRQTISIQVFQRLSSTNFTWFILEYFASFLTFEPRRIGN